MVGTSYDISSNDGEEDLELFNLHSIIKSYYELFPFSSRISQGLKNIKKRDIFFCQR